MYITYDHKCAKMQRSNARQATQSKFVSGIRNNQLNQTRNQVLFNRFTIIVLASVIGAVIGAII